MRKPARSFFVAVGLALGFAGLAHGQNHWEIRHDGKGRNFYAVTAFGGNLIAGGSDGMLKTSPIVDSLQWTERVSTAKGIIRLLAHDSAHVVAWDDGGQFLMSTDTGMTWTPVACPIKQSLNALVSNGKEWVAVGASGTILTSSDATHWTIATSGTIFNLASVATDGKSWVAVGSNGFDSGIVLVSENGHDWVRQTVCGDRKSYGVVHWKGEYVSPDGYSMRTSKDGKSWSCYLNYGESGSGMYGNDSILFDSHYLLTSLDSGAKSTVVENRISAHSIAWAGHWFVGVGEGEMVTRSRDGYLWDTLSESSALSSEQIAWNGKIYMTTRYRSNDGITWRPFIPMAEGSYGTLSLSGVNAIRWIDSLFYLGGNYGAIYTTPDGSRWHNRRYNIDWKVEDPDDFVFRDFRKRNGSVFAIAGRALSTINGGATWGGYRSIPNRYISCLEKKIHVRMASYSPRAQDVVRYWIATSFDGIGDSLKSGDVSLPYSAAGPPIACSNERIVFGSWNDANVAGESKARIDYSDDGMIIQKADFPSLPNGLFIKDVAWTGSQFVAVGTKGLVLTSPEGIHWKAGVSSTKKDLYSILVADSTIYVSGDSGIILASRIEAPIVGIPHRVSKSQPDWSWQLAGRMLSVTWARALDVQQVELRSVAGRRVALLDAKGLQAAVLPTGEAARGVYLLNLVTSRGALSRPVLLP